MTNARQDVDAGLRMALPSGAQLIRAQNDSLCLRAPPAIAPDGLRRLSSHSPLWSGTCRRVRILPRGRGGIFLSRISLRSQAAKQSAEDEAQGLQTVRRGPSRHACNMRFDDAKIRHPEGAKVF